MKSKGFTLVELLVTISILAVLSVIGLTVYSTVQSRARDVKRIGDVDNISKAFEAHFNDAGNALYPVPLESWFDSGIPQDPKNVSPYFYSWKGKDGTGVVTGGGSGSSYPSAASVTFTICAKLENLTGNATVTGTDSTAGDGTNFTTATGNGTHYCKKSLQ